MCGAGGPCARASSPKGFDQLQGGKASVLSRRHRVEAFHRGKDGWPSRVSLCRTPGSKSGRLSPRTRVPGCSLWCFQGLKPLEASVGGHVWYHVTAQTPEKKLYVYVRAALA